MHKKKNTWAKAIQAKQIFSKYAYIPTTDNPVLCQLYLVMQKAIEYASNLYNRPDYTKTFEKMQDIIRQAKSANGDDMLHQLLEFESDILDKKLTDTDIMANTINNSPKYSPKTFRMAMTLLSGELENNNDDFDGYIGEKFLAMASRVFIIPYNTCMYSRISEEAVDYLVSLGNPSKDLWESFIDYLQLMSSESHNGNYEEVITFDINGQPNAIYYGFRHNFVYRFHYTVKHVEMNILQKSGYDKIFSMNAVDHRQSFDVEPGDVAELDINDWSFIVNLWAAKQHNDFVVGHELQSNQSTVAEQINSICKKPNWSKYSYVHISDSGREAFNEAKQIIATYRGNAEYKKTMWYTRAYYARRGKNGLIVLNKASIHHRKCATPSEGTNITVYT
jgi:hypothetical protein